MNCNFIGDMEINNTFIVSIPNRDFDELQCSQTTQATQEPEFQSLIGILMNCNLKNFVNLEVRILFQSLIGILMNCNAHSFVVGEIDSIVSIPNRDFDELQSS